MKVSCLQENLARGLSMVSRAVAARSVLPNCSNVGGRSTSSWTISRASWLRLRRMRLATERNAVARAAFIDGDDGPGLPASRLLLASWEPSAAAKATGRPGVYVELQEGE